MSAPIRVLLLADQELDGPTVERLVDDPGIEIAGVVPAASASLASTAIDADAIVIACGSGSDTSLSLVGEVGEHAPGHPVVVVCTSSVNGFATRAIELGADDVVVADPAAPSAADTFFALHKAMARHGGKPAAAAGQDAGRGSLICVLGPKGGIGKTVTTANLIAGLATAGHSAVGIDLDLQFGDLGLSLGLEPERTIYDLATSGGVLDAEKLDGYLAEHASGARVLLAPVRPDQGAVVDVPFMQEIFSILRENYEFVVVDTPPAFTPLVIATVDAATSIYLVGMLDAPSLKNTKIGLETLDLMGYPLERLRVVLNRADTNVGISHSDVVSVVGRPPDVLVPSSRDVVRCVNAGEPIVLAKPRSEPAKAFRALTDLAIADRAPAASPTHRRSGLRLLRRS